MGAIMDEKFIFQPGPTTVDPELRWIAELRDLIRYITADLISEQLHIQYGDTRVEIHAIFYLRYTPTPELRKAIKSLVHTYARLHTKKFVLQRCEIFYNRGLIHLLIYRKPTKES